MDEGAIFKVVSGATSSTKVAHTFMFIRQRTKVVIVSLIIAKHFVDARKADVA